MIAVQEHKEQIGGHLYLYLFHLILNTKAMPNRIYVAGHFVP